MVKQAAAKKAAPVQPFHLSDFAQARIGRKALEVSRANGKEGPHYFVGHTADENGEGIALCEVDANGNVTRHWGTEDEHMARLNA